MPSKWWESINLVLGAALAWAAMLFGQLPVAAANAVIVGTLIVCASAVALYRYADWTQVSNVVLGGWAVIAPFLLGFGSAQVPMWAHVAIGLCVATIAAMQFSASRRDHTRARSISK